MIGPTILAALCCAYPVLVCLAALRMRKQRPPAVPDYLPVSILKPVRGVEDQLVQAVESHAQLEYSQPYELLLGVEDPNDPAIPVLTGLQQQYPHCDIKIQVCPTQTPNGKVGILMDLAASARYGVIIINDADIVVPSDYLQHVMDYLQQPAAIPPVGLVTCLYRAHGTRLPARWEAFGVAVDFMAGVMVARLIGVKEFGLGATLACTRESLAAIGGLQAISGYLADDYQLGKQITQQGYATLLAPLVVETQLSGATWREVWEHQVRWARTIRLSRGGGYWGIPLSYAGLWGLLFLVSGHVTWGIILLVLRYAAAWCSGVWILRSPVAAQFFVLAPVWDVCALAIWVAGLGGRQVQWRDLTMRLDAQGRILAKAARPPKPEKVA